MLGERGGEGPDAGVEDADKGAGSAALEGESSGSGLWMAVTCARRRALGASTPW